MKDNRNLEELNKEALTARQIAYGECILAETVMEEAYRKKRFYDTISTAAYEVLESEQAKKKETHQKLWEEYGKAKAQLDSQIRAIKKEASREHDKMTKNFKKASHALKNDRKYKAPGYTDTAYRHKVRRDALNSKEQNLRQKIKDAKSEFKTKDAENSKACHKARQNYQAARQNQRHAEREYNSARARYEAKAEALKAIEAETPVIYEVVCV